VAIQSQKSPNLPPSADLDEEKRISIIPEPPYHVFSRKQKWSVVVMIGVAGLFSGLSSNIYFPALDSIAKVGYCVQCTRISSTVVDTLQDLNVSLNTASLTITSYLVI